MITIRKIFSLLMCILIYGTIFSIPTDVKSEGSGSYPPPDQGDWVVTNETYVVNETVVLNGNLTINETGELWLTNVTIKFNCTSNGQFGMKIEGGGRLYAIDTVITAYNSSYYYSFRILNKTNEQNPDNNTIVHIIDSEIQYTQNGIEIYTSNVTFSNCNISNGLTYGISISSSSPIIQNCCIENNPTAGIKVNQTSAIYIYTNNITSNGIGIEVINSTVNVIGTNISNCSSYDLKLALASNMTTLDIIFNKTNVNIQDTSILIVNWSLVLDIVDAGGSSIPGALTVVRDSNGVEINNDTADNEGKINGIVTKEYEQNSTQTYVNATFYTPHNITSSSNSYTGYYNITMNATKNATVILPGPNLGILGEINISATIGNQKNINVTVENTGDQTIYNVTVGFYLGKTFFGEIDIGFNFTENNSLIDSRYISSITSGSNITLSGNWSNPEEGMHYIEVILDSDENTTEVYEQNNYRGQEYYVESNATKPYVVYGFVVDKDQNAVNKATVYVSKDQDIVTNMTDIEGRYNQNLLNLGSYSDSDLISVYATYEGKNSNTVEFTPDSEGGKMVNLSFNKKIGGSGSGNPPPLNGTNLVAESLTFIVNESGNLYNNGNIVMNTTVKIEILITNNGTVNASNVSVQFLDDNNQTGDIQVIPLIVSQESTYASVEWNPYPRGIHNITVAIDHNNTISEANETDNNITEFKMVREAIGCHLVCGWNNITINALNNTNFKAGALIAGTSHTVKFVTMYDDQTNQYINYIRNFSTTTDDFSINTNDTVFVYIPFHSKGGYIDIGSGMWRWRGLYVHPTTGGESGYLDGLRVQSIDLGYPKRHRMINMATMPYYTISGVKYDLAWEDSPSKTIYVTKTRWSDGRESLEIYTLYERQHYSETFEFKIGYRFLSAWKDNFQPIFRWTNFRKAYWKIFKFESYFRIDFDLVDDLDDEYAFPFQSWWAGGSIQWLFPSRERSSVTRGSPPYIAGYKILIKDDSDGKYDPGAVVYLTPSNKDDHYSDWIYCVRFHWNEKWGNNNPYLLAGRDARGNELIRDGYKGKDIVLWYRGWVWGTTKESCIPKFFCYQG